MNQYLLTAKSLCTYSKLVWFAMFLFAVISIGFMSWSIPLPAILFLGFGLIGISYSTRKFLASERRRLVPGMNEVCAQVVIFSMLACCGLSIALLVWCFGFKGEFVGGCFLALAFATWIGCMEKAAVPVLILFYAIPITMASFRDQLEPFANAYPTLPSGIHLAVGILLAAIGLALLVRFWYITTSRYSPLVYQPQKESSLMESRRRWSVGAIVTILSAALLVFAIVSGAVWPPLREATQEHFVRSAKDVAAAVTVSLVACSCLYFVWQRLLKTIFPSKQKMSDIGSLLYGKVGWQGWRTFVKIYALMIVFGLFLARMYLAPAQGDSESGSEMIVAGLMLLPFVAGTLMLHGIPALFSRLWISGASENRSQTAMIILLLIAFRSLIFSMLLLPFLLALGMFSSSGFAPTLLMAIVSIGVGAILVLVVARFYPFWVKHESFTVVMMLVTGGAFVIFAIPQLKFVLERAGDLIATVGSIPCLLIAFIATTALWWVCLNAAARSLGESSSVMECQNQIFESITNV